MSTDTIGIKWHADPGNVEAVSRQIVRNFKDQQQAAEALTVSLARLQDRGKLGGASIPEIQKSPQFKTGINELLSTQNAAGLERVTANILGVGASLKQLEANAYAGSRGFTVLARTIMENPVQAFKAIASGAALAESGLSRLGVASKMLNELISFATISRFGALALLYGGLSQAAEGFQLGIAAAKEFDSALYDQTRFLVLDGQAASAAKQQVAGLVDEQRKFATQWAVSVEDQSKAAQRLLAAGLTLGEVKKAYQDFAKFQIAFPEVELNKFTNSLIGLMNASKAMKGYKELADDTERLKKLLDQVTKAAAVSLIEPADLPVMISHMASMSTLAGILPEEMLAFGATLTDLGIKSQSAARLFRGLLVSLSSKEKIGMLEDMGVFIDKTKPLGVQLQNILAQLMQVANVNMEGSITVQGLEFINQLLPAERASIAAALMKDVAAGSAIYHKNLVGIANSQGAVDGAAKLMNESLKNQEKLFENLKKEISSMIGDVLGVGDAYSSLAVILGMVSMPLAVIGFAFREIAITAALAVHNTWQLGKAMLAFATGDLKGAEQAYRAIGAATDLWLEDSAKAYKKLEQRLVNTQAGIEKIISMNAQRGADERVKIAKEETKKKEDALNSMNIKTQPIALKFEDLKLFDDIRDKLRSIREIKPFEQIELNNRGLRDALGMLVLAGNDTKKLKSAMNEVASETVKVAGNMKIVEEAINKALNAQKNFSSQSGDAAKKLVESGNWSKADDLLRKNLENAVVLERMAKTDQQRIDALNQQIDVMKNMKEIKAGPYGGQLDTDIAQKIEEVQKLNGKIATEAIANAEKTVRAYEGSDMQEVARKIQRKFEEWPSAFDQAAGALRAKGGLKSELNEVLQTAQKIKEELADMAKNQVSSMQNRMKNYLEDLIVKENRRGVVPKVDGQEYGKI